MGMKFMQKSFESQNAVLKEQAKLTKEGIWKIKSQVEEDEEWKDTNDDDAILKSKRTKNVTFKSDNNQPDSLFKSKPDFWIPKSLNANAVSIEAEEGKTIEDFASKWT